MKCFKITVLIFAFFLTLSCKKNENPTSIALQGSWVNPVVEDTGITYQKANSLLDNSEGYTFEEQQIVINRHVEGWCGTPPISYSDTKGRWTCTDSLISIKMNMYGSDIVYRLKIIHLDNEFLTIISEKTDL